MCCYFGLKSEPLIPARRSFIEIQGFLSACIVAACFNPECRSFESKPQTDVEFGNRQVTRMLSDRPEMSKYVRKEDAIWKLARDYFGGKLVHRRIEWNPQEPDGAPFHLASHRYSPKCFICIRKEDDGELVSGERLWLALFFEFFNTQNDVEFNKNWEQACHGKLTRQQWIQKNSYLEFLALRKTSKFYDDVWLPRMKALEIKSCESYWKYCAREPFSEWFKKYRTWYPDDFLGKYFDLQIVPYIKSQARDASDRYSTRKPLASKKKY